MKLKDLTSIPWRLKTLITRRFVWTDRETGEKRVSYEDLCFTWAVVGIHSYKWWWVQRWGNLACGCMRNPLTRRFVGYSLNCNEHGLSTVKHGDEET